MDDLNEIRDRYRIDINPPRPELAKALDYLADSNAALHAATIRLAAQNLRLKLFLEGKLITDKLVGR